MSRSRISLICAAVVASVMLLSGFGCSVFGIRTTPEPAYTVVEGDGSFELRDYDDLLVAQTKVAASYDDASSTAFRRLFRYISGANSTAKDVAMTAPVLQEQEPAPKEQEPSSSEIAMTAPVLQQETGEGGWTMAFVLPDSYTLATAPQPSDPEVVLGVLPGRRVAVLRYSGSLSEERMEQRTAELREWIATKGLQPLSEPRSAGYDPPWTLPFLRRNEVLIDVAR